MESLHVDAERSLREVAGRLQRIAAQGPYGIQIAHMVTRRYRDALENHPDEQIRTDQWRDFFMALHAFLALHTARKSQDFSTLRSLLDENLDILPRSQSQLANALVRA